MVFSTGTLTFALFGSIIDLGKVQEGVMEKTREVPRELTPEERKDLEVIARTLESDPDYEKKKKQQRARAH